MTNPPEGPLQVVTLKPATRRALAITQRRTGEASGFVLRYFVGLVAIKLGAKIKRFDVPVGQE